MVLPNEDTLPFYQSTSVSENDPSIPPPGGVPAGSSAIASKTKKKIVTEIVQTGCDNHDRFVVKQFKVQLRDRKAYDRVTESGGIDNGGTRDNSHHMYNHERLTGRFDKACLIGGHSFDQGLPVAAPYTHSNTDRSLSTKRNTSSTSDFRITSQTLETDNKGFVLGDQMDLKGLSAEEIFPSDQSYQDNVTASLLATVVEATNPVPLLYSAKTSEDYLPPANSTSDRRVTLPQRAMMDTSGGRMEMSGSKSNGCRLINVAAVDDCTDFDIYNLDTTLPYMNWDYLEEQLRIALEKENKDTVSILYLLCV